MLNVFLRTGILQSFSSQQRVLASLQILVANHICFLLQTGKTQLFTSLVNYTSNGNSDVPSIYLPNSSLFLTWMLHASLLIPFMDFCTENHIFFYLNNINHIMKFLCLKPFYALLLQFSLHINVLIYTYLIHLILDPNHPQDITLSVSSLHPHYPVTLKCQVHSSFRTFVHAFSLPKHSLLQRFTSQLPSTGICSP